MTRKRTQASARLREGLKQGPTEVALRIVLERPPTGVDFCLQKGRGSAYETIRKQRSRGDDLEFEFTITVKTANDGAPDFAGPFIQGASGERFVYIDIGTYAGQMNTLWNRRLKVPLSAIDWAMIRKASAGSRNTLETRVSGT